jgi:hypothetical protein
MLVVMTGVATMLGVCVVLIQLTLRMGDSGRSRLVASATLDRLASQLRADVHLASTATIGPAANDQARTEPASAPASKPSDDSSLRLASAGGQAVSYRWSEGRLDRVESRNGAVQGRESFDLSSIAAVHFRTEELAGHRFVVARLERAGTSAPLIEFEALVGRAPDAGEGEPAPPERDAAPDTRPASPRAEQPGENEKGGQP